MKGCNCPDECMLTTTQWSDDIADLLVRLTHEVHADYELNETSVLRAADDRY